MRRLLLCALAPLLWLGLFACGELDPGEEGPPEGIDSIQYALSSIDCSESTATGYSAGKPFAITLVTVDGKKVERATANAYYVMAQAASAAGVNLKVVSGFRSMAEQTYFYNCYINCNCNNCNLAAKPGYSNHQSGHALDLNTSAGGVLSWLNKHAGSYGFKRTVLSEDWHWEWWGGGPGGGPCVPEPQFPLFTIKVSAATLADQDRDFCKLADSTGIFDVWKDQTVEMTIDVKNSGKLVGKNVHVELWSEEPYLKVKSWQILSDWKNPSFGVNDTDAMQKVARENPGKAFGLWLAAISPGETKRMALKVMASQFSVGAVDHPDLRAWVRHVDNFYEKAEWSTPPNNVGSHQQQNGGDLRSFFQLDVLDRESCDGKDNDCDGSIDEECDGEPVIEPEPAPPPPEPAPVAPLQPTPEPPDFATSGGCSALPGPPAAGFLPVLLGLGLLIRRRWR